MPATSQEVIIVPHSESPSFRLSKLQWALLIGAPVVVVGVGAWYLYFRRQKSKGSIRRKGNSAPVKKVVDAKDNNQVKSPTPWDKAMALKNKGNKLFKGHFYDQAIVCYTEAIQECPSEKKDDLATFYQNRAASYEMLKKYQEVIEDCTKAIDLKKDYVKALSRRAKAYEELGQLQNSLNDITTACIIEQFQNNSNVMMIDRVLKTQSKIKAKDYFRNKPPRVPSKNFIRHYFSSYSRDPIIKNDEFPSDIEELQNRFNSISQSEENRAEAALLKGTINILKGTIEEAEKDLETLAKMENCEANIKVNGLIKLGTIKIHDMNMVENINEALKYFDEAIKIDSDNPDIYLHRAQIFIMSERADEALKDLEKCCSLNDSFPSAVSQKLYVQFRCASRLNNFNEVNKAIEGFKEAIEKFPSSSEVFSLYAQILIEQQKFAESDEYFIKALKIDPTDGNIYVHRGILHMHSDKIDNAIQFLEEAKQVDPSCQFAYEMLGSIEVQRGNIQKGLLYFKTALELVQAELDCAHLFSLHDAAEAQMKAAQLLGIELPSIL